MDSCVLGNTNTKTRIRRICLTLNNYTEEELETLKSFVDINCKYYIIGKEIGDNGTPHLQGYLEFYDRKYFDTLKKFNKRIHWEQARGNKQQNIKYCSKENNYIEIEKELTLQEKIDKKILNKKYKNVIWKEWQQKILDTIKEEADDRKINWIIDEKGNTGKSFLVKYISLTEKGVVIADGKKDNILNQIKILMEKEEPRIIMLDIPRHNKEYINYGVIEMIKNGLIYSGKYEGGICRFDDVHILIFSNDEPEYWKFTEDRWNIIRL